MIRCHKIFFTTFLFLFLAFNEVLLSQSHSRYSLSWSIDSITSSEGSRIAIIDHENAIHLAENSYLPLFELRLTNTRVSNFQLLNTSTGPLTFTERNITRGDTIGISEVRILEEESDNGSITTVIQIPTIIENDNNSGLSKILSFEIIYDIVERFNVREGTSVLSQGRWFKLGVFEDNIYRIDRNFLSSMGIDVGTIDPRTIQIYGNGGDMLPQENSVPRPTDLIENSIEIVGEEDGSFDPEDFIIFFGQNPDYVNYDVETELFEYQNNLYSDTTFYFLTFGQNLGKRVENIESLQGSFEEVSEYTDFDYFENDSTLIIAPGSGREWYDIRLIQGRNTTRRVSFEKPGIVPNSSIRLGSTVLSQSFNNSEFETSINGNILGRQSVAPIPNRPFAIRGQESDTAYSFNSNSVLNNTDNLLVQTEYFPQEGSQTSIGHLNRFTIETRRFIRYYNAPSVFRALNGEYVGNVSFSVGNSNSFFSVWDITDPLNPLNQSFEFDGVIHFSQDVTLGKEYMVFDPNELELPVFDKEITNQNIKALPVSELLIVTNKKFLNEAERYSSFKRGVENISTTIVTVDQIYNEFSSGSQDISAVRDFIRFQFNKSFGDNGLKYVLFFGKGTYDYKDRVPNNSNYVPTYESRNSLDPLASYSSDDFFGFMDENEGEWEESRAGDHFMDLGIGRFPVATQREASGLIDKIIHYKTSDNRFGRWRNNVLFVADDEDNNLHQRHAEQLSNMIDTVDTEVIVDKIYLDAFEQQITPVERSPLVTEALLEQLNEGTLVVNYSGHGGEIGLADEQIFQISEVTQLDNIDRLPLFVTATCEFGRNDDPFRISAGELLVTNDNGGAIALVTTTRLVFSNSNLALNRALYEVFFRDENGSLPTLGQIMIGTKNNSLSGVNNRNFTLLGDPSLTLNYPEFEVITNEITNVSSQNNIDTLGALSRTVLSGNIMNSSGNIVSDFNGEVNVRIYDKPGVFQTLGTNQRSQVENYQIREGILFNGRATVTNGAFSIETIIPRNINFSFGNGRIHYYAVSDDFDANGANQDIIIGGSETEFENDNINPRISIFLDDTTFVSGNTVNESPLLLVRLSDESGINISNEGFVDGITMSLDGGATEGISEFFVSDLDDFTNGWVILKLDELSLGSHNLRISASDNFNNRGTTEVDFVVGEGNGIRILNARNSPNPIIRGETSIFNITHNRLFEDVEVVLRIMDLNGAEVFLREASFFSSSGTINEISWNGRSDNGNLLQSGLYIYTIEIISRNDGSRDIEGGRIILQN